MPSQGHLYVHTENETRSGLLATRRFVSLSLYVGVVVLLLCLCRNMNVSSLLRRAAAGRWAVATLPTRLTATSCCAVRGTCLCVWVFLCYVFGFFVLCCIMSLGFFVQERERRGEETEHTVCRHMIVCCVVAQEEPTSVYTFGMQTQANG